MSENLAQIHLLLEPILEGTDMYIVNITIKPTNNIKVFLDADTGFSIEKAVTVNRHLYHAIEGTEMYLGGDFSLEVSSPGVDEPLLQMRQYAKNVGRKVAVTLNDDSEKVGFLREANDEYINIETQEGKQKLIKNIIIPFSDIKKTVVQIIF